MALIRATSGSGGGSSTRTFYTTELISASSSYVYIGYLISSSATSVSLQAEFDANRDGTGWRNVGYSVQVTINGTSTTYSGSGTFTLAANTKAYLSMHTNGNDYPHRIKVTTSNAVDYIYLNYGETCMTYYEGSYTKGLIIKDNDTVVNGSGSPATIGKLLEYEYSSSTMKIKAVKNVIASITDVTNNTYTDFAEFSAGATITSNAYNAIKIVRALPA